MRSTSTDALARPLADPLRARLCELLADEQLCVCHLAEETGAPQSTVSHHLAVLRAAGLVGVAPAGRYTYYRLLPGQLDALAERASGLARQARQPPARRPCP